MILSANARKFVRVIFLKAMIPFVTEQDYIRIKALAIARVFKRYTRGQLSIEIIDMCVHCNT